MAQNIYNEHNSSRHVDFSTPMPTHNSRQPQTICSMHAGRCVIKDAIERNSWGKSRCEWMCCFPNTGGLHRISRDAPHETHSLIHNTSLQPSINCVCPCRCYCRQLRQPPPFTIDCAAAPYAQGSSFWRILVELKPFSS